MPFLIPPDLRSVRKPPLAEVLSKLVPSVVPGTGVAARKQLSIFSPFSPQETRNGVKKVEGVPKQSKKWRSWFISAGTHWRTGFI